MKKILAIALLLSAAMWSCSSDTNIYTSEERGSISLNTSLDFDTENMNTRATSRDVATFSVILDGPEGEQTIPYPTGGVIADLAPGEYTVTLTSHPEGMPDPDFDVQVYSGTAQTTVDPGDDSEVTIVCYLANAGIYFDYSLLTDTQLEGVVPTLTRGDVDLVYEGENSLATGYFAPGTVTLSVMKDDVPVKIGNGLTRDFEVEAKDLLKITLKLTEVATDGSLSISATVDNETNDRDETIVLDRPEPETAITSVNSFVVTPGGSTQIAVKAVYEIWNHYFSQELTGNPEPFILWESTAGLIEALEIDEGPASEAMITARTSNTPGNAMIGVRIDGAVRWTWHLWVTADDLSAGTSVTAQGLELMDRDLGALSVGALGGEVLGEKTWGLYYQWGRTAPVAWADQTATANPTYTLAPLYGETGTALTYATSSSDVSVDFAIKNPTIFIKPEGADKWLGYDGDDSWMKDGRKTPFDPCPHGWRVPYGATTDGELVSPWYGSTVVKKFSGANARGMTLNDVWYPAAGMYTASVDLDSNPVLSSAGTICYHWLANSAVSVEAEAGTSERMYAGGLGSPMYNSPRVRWEAYSIRCAKDLDAQ